MRNVEGDQRLSLRRIEKIATQVFLGDLIGRAARMRTQQSHRTQISVLRLDAQAIELQRMAHAREKIEGHDFASSQAANYGLHSRTKSSQINWRSARKCRILYD